MTTQNVCDAPFPLSATKGGLGVASPTSHGILVGEGASAVTSIVLAAGQILIGTTASDPSAASLSAGGGISIASASGSITISSTGGGLTWSTVTGTTQAAAVNNGYFANNAGIVTVTLPATAAVGSIVEVAGQGAGGWTLAANTGQTIIFGNQVTSSAGSWSSTDKNDTIRVVCQVANTTWQVLSAVSAGLTVA